jgi:hypothetical protein
MVGDETIRFWGLENLGRWAPSSLADVRIPDESRHFLTDVGLPIGQDWTLHFDPNVEAVPRVAGRPNYRRIGFDDVMPICIDELRGGRVLVLDTDDVRQDRFVNSSVEQFGQFLAIYGEYRRGPSTMSEDDILAVIADIEERMRKLDPASFELEDSYWPLIIEQMNDGLL